MNETLEFRRVRYLYEAVVRGSVRAAADTLDMNPSVVSRQIAKLEEELAIPLIERHGRGVKATEAGEMLVEYFRQQSAYQDDVLTKVQELRGMARGHIDLVLGEGFVSDLMAEPMKEFWRRYPGLTVTMHLAGTNEVMRLVAEDAAHIGMVYNPPVASGIRSRAAIRQPMCVVTRPGHPLTELKRQPLLRQVGAYPVALMHGSFGTRQVIELAEQMERVRLAPKLTTDSISVIKHFVRSDLGVSLLPAFAVSQEIDDGELVAIPVDQALLGAAEAHIVTRLGRQLSIASNQLLLQLIATMRAFKDSKPRHRGKAGS
ncbi:LysR family transcriptional regulator [Variovorax ginsengisoli]|uniref:DNA-binding transcriptional LysR family regulator n=1 Tax=Variovorax ginsengisoli TaxID=363844 RepID=A0ABT9SF64_9BURK|nr:LysR family transcriptional regulator [Variovorax ginsengisoli]MDP9902999.1 DNA-binding transcriptional LysR family regulator [Variovorax ginsengisoli]